MCLLWVWILDRADLIFEKEYNLNTKPLEIDLLVIKKEASFQIGSEIGKSFKGHNIVEYKSPEDHLDIDTFFKTLDRRSQMTEKADRELADSVLEVSISANREIVDELIGYESMYEALMEIMEPKIKQREDAIIKKGIQGTVDTLRDFGHEDAEIKKAIIKRYNLSLEEAEDYLKNV